jgi:hypothetical protein
MRLGDWTKSQFALLVTEDLVKGNSRAFTGTAAAVSLESGVTCPEGT